MRNLTFWTLGCCIDKQKHHKNEHESSKVHIQPNHQKPTIAKRLKLHKNKSATSMKLKAITKALDKDTVKNSKCIVNDELFKFENPLLTKPHKDKIHKFIVPKQEYQNSQNQGKGITSRKSKQ